MYLSSQYSISVDESEEENISLLQSDRTRRSIFSLNEVPTYGIYNRNDFMARCYRRCRTINVRSGPQLRKLLWFGGESSKSGDCCSSFLFMLVIIFPVICLLAFLPIPSHKHLGYDTRATIVSVMVGLLTVLSLWHTFSLFVIIHNARKWKRSWFTFQVRPSMMPIPQNMISRRFFDIRRNMVFYDITKESLPTFPLLSAEQKKNTLKMLMRLNIDRARVILHTKEFMRAVNRFPRNFAISLLTVSLTCLGFMVFELFVVLDKLH